MPAALILAAGGSSRFGAEPKLLADLHGRPVLQWTLDNVRGVPWLDPVVVVLGADADRIRAAVDLGDARVVLCPDWHTGQSASLRRGLGAVGDAGKVLVLLGDQPLVGPDVIARLAAEPAGSRAAYHGVPGHPVVLGPELVGKARTLAGDRGLRDLVRWRLVEVGDLASDRDLDTPEDLEAIRDEARAVL